MTNSKSSKPTLAQSSRDQYVRLLEKDNLDLSEEALRVERDEFREENSKGYFKDGELHGPLERYRSYVLSEKSNYNNGKLDGSYKTYSQNGELWRDEVYKNGNLMSKKIAYYRTVCDKTGNIYFIFV